MLREVVLQYQRRRQFVNVLTPLAPGQAKLFKLTQPRSRLFPRLGRNKTINPSHSIGNQPRTNLCLKILDFSKIEANKLELETEVFALTDIIRQLDSMFRSQVQEKNLTLKFRFGGKCEKYYVGDALRLNQVLVNLVSNAVKFTHSGGIDVFPLMIDLLAFLLLRPRACMSANAS